MIETIRWRPVERGRIAEAERPARGTFVYARLENDQIMRLRVRHDGYLGCNVRYWCASADRILETRNDEIM